MAKPELPNYDESCFWVDGVHVGTVTVPKAIQLNDYLKWLTEQLDEVMRKVGSFPASAGKQEPESAKNAQVEREKKWCSHYRDLGDGTCEFIDWKSRLIVGPVKDEDANFCSICRKPRPAQRPEAKEPKPEKSFKERLEDFAKSQKDMPTEFAKVLNDNFWELVSGKTEKEPTNLGEISSKLVDENEPEKCTCKSGIRGKNCLDYHGEPEKRSLERIIEDSFRFSPKNSPEVWADVAEAVRQRIIEEVKECNDDYSTEESLNWSPYTHDVMEGFVNELITRIEKL